jgi:hypothetical protein
MQSLHLQPFVSDFEAVVCTIFHTLKHAPKPGVYAHLQLNVTHECLLLAIANGGGCMA